MAAGIAVVVEAVDIEAVDIEIVGIEVVGIEVVGVLEAESGNPVVEIPGLVVADNLDFAGSTAAALESSYSADSELIQ